MSNQNPQNEDLGLHFEHTDVWVSDFGSTELEKELLDNVMQIKQQGSAKRPSWVFTSLGIIVFLVISELAIRQISTAFFWSELTIFWLTWSWRTFLLLAWFYLGHFRMNIEHDRLLLITIIGFTVSVLVSAIMKIFVVQATWTVLNLLVEPIWMVLLAALVSAIMFKLNFKK